MSLDHLTLKGLKKATLHCARHPGYDVIGALSSEDAFPMFHSRVTTAITETTLNLLKHQHLIGFYESRILPANAVMEPSKLILTLANALKAKGVGQVLILCIDSDWQHLSTLYLYTLTQNSFTKIYEYPSNIINELKDYVLQNQQIYDFDDHYSNISIDWKNLHIS